MDEYTNKPALVREKTDHKGVHDFFRNIFFRQLEYGKEISLRKGNTSLTPIFLYGPFKRGEENHLVVRALDGIYVADGAIEGFDLWATENFTSDKMLPAMLEGLGKVKGELFLMPHIEEFEQYKGFPFLYERAEVEVNIGKYQTKARSYLYKDNDLTYKIVSGEF